MQYETTRKSIKNCEKDIYAYILNNVILKFCVSLGSEQFNLSYGTGFSLG